MNLFILSSNSTTVQGDPAVTSPLVSILFVLGAIIITFVLCFACGGTYARFRNSIVEWCTQCRRDCRCRRKPSVNTVTYINDSLFYEL